MRTLLTSLTLCTYYITSFEVCQHFFLFFLTFFISEVLSFPHLVSKLYHNFLKKSSATFWDFFTYCQKTSIRLKNCQTIPNIEKTRCSGRLQRAKKRGSLSHLSVFYLFCFENSALMSLSIFWITSTSFVK